VEFVRENPGEPVPEETFTHYSHRMNEETKEKWPVQVQMQNGCKNRDDSSVALLYSVP